MKLKIWPWSKINELKFEISVLRQKLEYAKRNDARDERGRYCGRPRD